MSSSSDNATLADQAKSAASIAAGHAQYAQGAVQSVSEPSRTGIKLFKPRCKDDSKRSSAQWSDTNVFIENASTASHEELSRPVFH